MHKNIKLKFQIGRLDLFISKIFYKIHNIIQNNNCNLIIKNYYVHSEMLIIFSMNYIKRMKLIFKIKKKIKIKF